MPLQILFVVATVLMTGLFHIMPVLTRPDLFFAVTVAPEFRGTPDAQRILRRYRAIVWSSALVAMALGLAAGVAWAAVLVLGAGFIGALVSSHGRALAYAAAPSPIREVDLAAPRESLPGGPIIAVLPVLFLAVLGLWAGLNWDRLPQRFPVHWGMGGGGSLGDHHPRHSIRVSRTPGRNVSAADRDRLGTAALVPPHLDLRPGRSG